MSILTINRIYWDLVGKHSSYSRATHIKVQNDCLLFNSVPIFRMFLDNLKPSTFTFFKFKVPNFKHFLWNIGTGNMSESYRGAMAVLDNVKSSVCSYFKFLSVCGVLN